jgi:hypothetical protein
MVRLVGAEFGEAMAITLLIDMIFPNPMCISSMDITTTSEDYIQFRIIFIGTGCSLTCSSYLLNSLLSVNSVSVIITPLPFLWKSENGTTGNLNIINPPPAIGNGWRQDFDTFFTFPEETKWVAGL